MKTFTKFSSAFLIGCMMLASANLFAQQAVNSNDKKSNCFILGAVIQQQNIKCYGGTTGLAILFATGSTGPYTFTWSPTATSNSFDSIDAGTGLAAGTYTVAITNGLGCTGSVNVTITQPPKLTVATTSVVEDKCFGGTNGKAILSASGGTPFKGNPNYTFGWAPNVSKVDSATNLKAGTYIVTVTDTNRCTAKDTVIITQPVQIATTKTIIPSSCTTTNGSVGVTASAGVLPYTYSWTPSGNTTDSITGLGAGTYTCTITDANTCSVTVSAIVTDSTSLIAALRVQANEKCNGNTIGTAAVTVTGGNGPVTYGWAPTGGTDTTASGLGAGTYTFTATDSVGCQALSVITITQPRMLRDSMANLRQVACFGASTGRATAGVVGGVGPYTYAWSTGSTASNITGVPAGPLTVIITDKNGCVDSAKTTLSQPATAVADSNKVIAITCYGGTTTATVYAYNGTPFKNNPNYTYTWSTAGSNTTSSVSGLTAGTYIVRIRDSNRCTLRDTITITQPASYIIANDTLLSSTAGCGNSAWVQVVGSLSKYTFAWSPSGGSHDTASSLCVGMYVVTITDSTGCSINDTINIVNPTGVQQYTNNTGIKVYPNPAKDQINISIGGNSFTAQTVKIYDMTGRNILSQNVNANVNLITIDLTRLSEGTYFMKLQGTSGEKIFKFSVAGR